MPTSITIPAVPLNSWDVVYSCHFSDVNKAIIAKGTTPSSFSYEYKDKDDGTTYSLKGKFDPWSLIPGGDGHLVHLNVPVKDVIFVVTELKGDITNILISFATFSIEIQLDWLSEPSENNQVKHLKVSSDRDNVFLIKEDYGETQIPLPYKSLIKDFFLDMLKQHLDYFQHIFATLDYTHEFDDKFQWLKPTSEDYSVITTADGSGGGGVLAILCMTEGRSKPPSNLMPQSLIPQNANTGYCFNQLLMFNNMVKPALPNLFINSKPEDFASQSGGYSGYNVRELTFKPMNSSGGIQDNEIRSTAPQGSFVVGVFGGMITINMNEVFYIVEELYETVTVTLTYTANHFIKLNKDGRISVTVAQAGKPEITRSSTQATWQKILNIIRQVVVLDACMSAGSVFAAITIEEVAALAARLSITIEEAAVEMATDTVTSEIDAETASIMDIFGGEIEITSEEVESMVADITDGYGESVAGSEYISLSTVKDLSADVKKTSNFFRLPSANTVLSTLYGFLLNKGFSSFEEYIENNDFSNPDNIPLITDLYKQVISVTTWPDKSKDNFTIVDGQLTDGCFRIGINV